MIKTVRGVSFLFVMVIHLIWMLSILFLERVIEGLDIIDKIAGLPRDNRNNPLKRIDMKIILKPKN